MPVGMDDLLGPPIEPEAISRLRRMPIARSAQPAKRPRRAWTVRQGDSAASVVSRLHIAPELGSPSPLEVTRGEIRCLVDHSVVHVGGMRGPVAAVRTDRVVGGAQLDGLGLIQRADDDRRRADDIREFV